MANLATISLNSGWMCAYFEMHSGPHGLRDEVPVPSLVEWVFDKRRVENWAARLQRGFDLEPTDVCVNYILHLDSAPEETLIYVNGEKLGMYNPPGPFDIDVTPYVALEYNDITFQVEWNAAGRFEGVRLQPVPCE